MPNRFIKESTCVSESLNGISPQAERLFWRLVVKADDYGLYFGGTKVIKNTCLPLLADVIKDHQLEKWLAELEASGQIFRYKSKTDEKCYLKITNWEEHQQTRAAKPKYPPPKDDEIICNQLITIAPRATNTNTNTLSNYYGEFKNVLLTDLDIKKLQDEVLNWQQYIEDLSAYMASKGVNYKSHYATIRQWAARDKKEGKQRASPAATKKTFAQIVAERSQHDA